MEGFELIMIPGGRGRGIALYMKKKLQKKLQKIKLIDQANVQAIIATFSSFSVAGVYIPPNSDSYNALLHLQIGSHDPSKNCILLGDFNFDYQSQLNHPIRQHLESKQFHQRMTSPTHYKGNVIDHIYTRGNLKVQEVTRLPAYYSDHFGLGISLKKPQKDGLKVKRRKKEKKMKKEKN